MVFRHILGAPGGRIGDSPEGRTGAGREEGAPALHRARCLLEAPSPRASARRPERAPGRQVPAPRQWAVRLDPRRFPSGPPAGWRKGGDR